MSGRQLRMVPYNGNRAYKYNLDGYKVNGKRKRLFFKDERGGPSRLKEFLGCKSIWSRKLVRILCGVIIQKHPLAAATPFAGVGAFGGMG